MRLVIFMPGSGGAGRIQIVADGEQGPQLHGDKGQCCGDWMHSQFAESIGSKDAWWYYGCNEVRRPANCGGGAAPTHTTAAAAVDIRDYEQQWLG